MFGCLTYCILVIVDWYLIACDTCLLDVLVYLVVVCVAWVVGGLALRSDCLMGLLRLCAFRG